MITKISKTILNIKKPTPHSNEKLKIKGQYQKIPKLIHYNLIHVTHYKSTTHINRMT